MADTGNFDDLLALKAGGGPLSALQVSLADTLSDGVPNDYREFLRRIGWGEFGDCNFMLYEAPVASSDIYGEGLAEPLKSTLLFGDDFCGWNAGFDGTAGKVVEIDPTNREIIPTGLSFGDYVRELIRRLHQSSE